MYPVVTFGFPSRPRCDRGAAPGFSQHHAVDRRFGALRRGINGQTAPARPWPDEKPAEDQGWPRMAGPAAYVADPCDVSDCLDDDRLAAGHVATVTAAPEGSRAHRRADRRSRQGLIEES
jgi:hypothetical protein